MLLVLRVLLSLATTRLNTQNRKGRIIPQSLLKHPEGLTEKYIISIITLNHMTCSAPLTQFHRKQEWKLTCVEPRGLTWMLIDWDRSGRTGKCLTLCSVCSVRSVRTSWTRVNYYRFRPSHSVNNYIFWAESLEYSLRPSLRYASTRVWIKQY